MHISKPTLPLADRPMARKALLHTASSGTSVVGASVGPAPECTVTGPGTPLEGVFEGGCERQLAAPATAYRRRPLKSIRFNHRINRLL